MVSAEFEPGCTSTMMQSAAAAATDPLSPEASYLRGMAAAGYPHPESGLPHPHHPHMQVKEINCLCLRQIMPGVEIQRLGDCSMFKA